MKPPTSEPLAVFVLDGQLIALGVSQVERVVRAVEIAPLAGAPTGVRGVINVQGKIVPVFDLRTRFGLKERPVRLSDFLVISHAGRRTVALLVENAHGVIRGADAQVVPGTEILPGCGTVEGVAKLAGDIVFLHDLAAFLSPTDETTLAAALGT